MSPRLVIDARPGEGAGAGVGGKKAADHIGQPLADKLLVSVDALVGLDGDGPGDGKRLDKAEQGHRQCAGGQKPDGVRREVGTGKGRQAGRQFAQQPDAGGLAPQSLAQKPADDHGGEQAGPLGPPGFERGGGGERADGHRRLPGIDEFEVPEKDVHGGDKRDPPGNIHAQGVLELPRGDEDGGPGGEPHHHGMGDEVDQRPQTRQTGGGLKKAGQESQGERQLDVGRRSGFGEGAQGGKNDDGNGGGGAGHQVTGRAEQGRHHGSDDGRVDAEFRREPRDHGESHPLGQHDERAGEPGEEVRPQGRPVDQGKPGEKGQQAAGEDGRKRPGRFRGGWGHGFVPGRAPVEPENAPTQPRRRIPVGKSPDFTISRRTNSMKSFPGLTGRRGASRNPPPNFLRRSAQGSAQDSARGSGRSAQLSLPNASVIALKLALDSILNGFSYFLHRCLIFRQAPWLLQFTGQITMSLRRTWASMSRLPFCI